MNSNPSSRERLFLRTAYVPFWWRTVSLGTYCYCCGGVHVYTYSSTVLFFFVSAIKTLIVVACHVLFVTTVWISESELCESINIIIMMLISAHVLVVLYA